MRSKSSTGNGNRKQEGGVEKDISFKFTLK